uniref:Uncharacterized protein MANES_09G108800 n=1 Tax=Rhizophora mucronata TaxID=61149 RepID=A0A2P2K6X6_RHIMU
MHVDIHCVLMSGYVKKILEQKTGLEPERQKILFRGQEKEDGEYLHEAGVKENSKLLVLEDAIRKEKKFEQMKDGEEMLKGGFKENEEMKNGANSGNEGQSDVENNERAEMSEAFQAIAVVRTEVDKLAERVAALEAVVNGGTRVAEDEFTVSSELLMRQLLKLDSIEAEGEARVQRKAEVRRVQSFHEILDNLKARNSKPFSNGDNSVTVTTNWETFDSGMGSLTPPPPTSSSIRITQDWERFD